jgi:hypothetical protein
VRRVRAINFDFPAPTSGDFTRGSRPAVWLALPKEEGRRETGAEKITICVLTAPEHAFANAGHPTSDQVNMLYN